MLKELNNLYYCLVVVLLIFFLQCHDVFSYDLSSTVNGTTKSTCVDEIDKHCPSNEYVTKQDKKKCIKKNKILFSKECQNFALSSNNNNNSNFTMQQQAELYLIFTNACQSEAIDICNAKVKKNILKINSIDRCLKRISGKQKNVSRKCTIALTSYMNSLINEKINNNEYVKEGSIEKMAKKLKDNNDLKKMSLSKMKKIEKQAKEEEGPYGDDEEYTYYTNGTKIKNKYLRIAEKKFAKSGAMSNEEHLKVVNQFLIKQGWIEEDN